MEPQEILMSVRKRFLICLNGKTFNEGLLYLKDAEYSKIMYYIQTEIRIRLTVAWMTSLRKSHSKKTLWKKPFFNFSSLSESLFVKRVF